MACVISAVRFVKHDDCAAPSVSQRRQILTQRRQILTLVKVLSAAAIALHLVKGRLWSTLTESRLEVRMARLKSLARTMPVSNCRGARKVVLTERSTQSFWLFPHT